MGTWNLYLRDCKRFSALCPGSISDRFTVTKISDLSSSFHIWSERARGNSTWTPQTVNIGSEVNRFRVAQENVRILQKPRVHDAARKGHILSQMSPLHSLILLLYHPINITPSTPKSFKLVPQFLLPKSRLHFSFLLCVPHVLTNVTHMVVSNNDSSETVHGNKPKNYT